MHVTDQFWYGGGKSNSRRCPDTEVITILQSCRGDERKDAHVGVARRHHYSLVIAFEVIQGAI